MDDVIIKIGASSKQFTEEMDKIQGKTEDLREHLAKMTAVAGAGFAAFSAIIAGSVVQFNEQEQESLKLNSILTATGGIAGVTARDVESLSEALNKSTIFSRDQITEAQTLLLTFTNIGQETFPAATKATLDLAQATGQSATTAAQMLGRALQDPILGMQHLRREGVTFTSVQQSQIQAMTNAGNVAGAQALILEVITQKYGGLSEAALKGGGQITKLKQAIGDASEDLGAHFAPAVNAAAGKLVIFFDWVKEHPEVTSLAAAVLTAGVAVTGIATAAGVASLAILKVRAAMLAAKVSIDLTKLSVNALIGATGIGLLIVVGTEVALHWDSIWPRMQGVFQGFVTTVSGALQGFGKILMGVLIFNSDSLDLIKEGWSQVTKAFADGGKQAYAAITGPVKDANRDVAKENDTAANDIKAKNKANGLAQQALENEKRKYDLAAVRAQNQALLLEYGRASAEVIAYKTEEAKLLKEIAAATGVAELASIRSAAITRLAAVRQLEQDAAALEGQRQKAEKEGLFLEESNASAKLITLKKKEIDDLKNLQDLNFKGNRALVQKDLADTRALYATEHAKELVQQKKFDQLMRTNDAQFKKLSKGQQLQFENQKKQALMDGLNTEADANANFYEQELNLQIQANNQFLANQVEFGTAYATIYDVMHTKIAEGTNKSFAALAQLTQSHNAVLKTAGQIAASEQIAFKTAQSAMEVYSGFQSLPFGIGIPLGLAAAGLVIAYGVEQEASVWAASKGGVMTGGVPGVDSIRTLTMPGELITPSMNYEEAVGSIAATRAAKKLGLGAGEQSGGNQVVEHVITFKGDAARLLTEMTNRDKALGTYRGRS